MQTYHTIKLVGIMSPIILFNMKVKQSYNEHARIWIEGRIPEGLKDSLVFEALYGQEIGIELTNQEESKPFFYGLLESASIRQKQDVYYIQLKGISKSKLLDIEKEYRSFQDITQSFDAIVADRMQGIEGQYINEDKKKAEEIGRFTLQYHETRWEFIQRLISRHHEGLIPDIQSNQIAYWIGMPQGRIAHVVDDTKVSYQSTRIPLQAKTYIDNQKIGDISEQEFFSYTILNHLEIYQLGDPITFRGLSLRIIEIKSHLDAKQAVLYHDYTCVMEEGYQQPLRYNEQIRGLSLEGIVIDRRKDFTKMHLVTIDAEQPLETASWFRTCTYYTAGSDGGWCAMPEIHDQLSLYFPTIEENDCFLLDSTQVPYTSSIYPHANTTSKAGMNPANPNSGEDKTQVTVVASKTVEAPNGQSMLLEDTMIHFRAQNGASTISLFTNHPDPVTQGDLTLGIQFITQGDMKLDNGNQQVKNIQIGVPKTEGATEPSQEIFFYSEKDVCLICEGSSIVLNHETGMTDYYATYIELLPPQ